MFHRTVQGNVCSGTYVECLAKSFFPGLHSLPSGLMNVGARVRRRQCLGELLLGRQGALEVCGDCRAGEGASRSRGEDEKRQRSLQS